MSDIIKRLHERLSSMSQDELDREWEELKHWNEVGPTCDEYFAWLKEADLYPKKI